VLPASAAEPSSGEADKGSCRTLPAPAGVSRWSCWPKALSRHFRACGGEPRAAEAADMARLSFLRPEAA